MQSKRQTEHPEIPHQWQQIAAELSVAYPNKIKLIFALINQAIVTTNDIPVQLEYDAIANDIKKILSSVLSNEALIHKLRTDKKEQEKLNQKFIHWAKKSHKLATKLDMRTRTSHATHAAGISTQLRKGLDYSHVWGNDNDARNVLGNHLTSADKITRDGTYILPPVNINNVEELRDQLVTALEAPANKLTVLVPLANNKHWQLGIFEINDGEITKATLWDSLAAPFLKYSKACKNMQKAINQAQISSKPKAKVMAHATGIQRNGYSCFDYVTQKALSLLKPGSQLSPELKTIAEAKTASVLRQAIATQIATRLGITLRQPKTNHTQAITTYNEEKLLNQLQKFSESSNHQMRNLQIDFDAILAKELQQRYKNPKDKRSDQAILAEARNAAYAKWHTLNKNIIQKAYAAHGVFGSRTTATKAELQSKSESTFTTTPALTSKA